MSKYKIILSVAVLASLLVGTQSLFAGTLIKHESNEGGISYEIVGDKMRMNLSQAGEMYYLVNGENVYQVMTQDDSSCQPSQLTLVTCLAYSATKQTVKKNRANSKADRATDKVADKVLKIIFSFQ